MLIGREHVLARGDSLIAGALASRGSLLLLAGEAGIGKTSIARELGARAEAAGATMRWAACWEGCALLPFSVWIDCLRHGGSDACGRAATRLEVGDVELASDTASAERQRQRLFAEVVAALRQAAAGCPQIVVLEDLHWADTASLQLLVAVAAHAPSMRILLVATFRDDELAPGGPLDGLGGRADRVVIGGLDAPEVTALFELVLGRSPSAAEARMVHRQTAGNPLFVNEIARLVASGSAARVPTGAREILSRRLARLSPDCDRVLGVAAVLGTEFDVDTLVAVSGCERREVLASLDEAIAARLCTATDRHPPRAAFVHDLVRSTRYEASASAERQALHRRAVDVLEHSPGVAAGVLAHHAARATFEAGDPRPVAIAVAAAREAISRSAWADAISLADGALATASAGSIADEVVAGAWIALGDARLRTADADGAAAAFNAVAEIGRRCEDPELVARAALGFGAGLGSFEVRLDDERQLALLEEAAQALPPSSGLRPLVLARLSVALSIAGPAERRQALAAEAVAAARRLDDPRALAAALAAQCDVESGPDHVSARLDSSSEIISLALRAGDPGLELLGRRHRVVTLLELRDLAAFDAEVEIYARAASLMGDPLYSWYVALWRAMRAYAAGRLDEVARLSTEARALGEAAASANANMLCLVTECEHALDRLDEPAARSAWEALLGEHPEIAQLVTTGISAMIHARSGHPERAGALLERDGLTDLARVPRDQEWLICMVQYLEAGVLGGVAEVVRQAYELLSPYEGLGVFEGIAAADRGSVDRFLARGAGFMGDLSATRRHVDRALALVEEAGDLLLAQTRADCARALLAAGDTTDRAQQLATAATAEFARLGLDAPAAQLAVAMIGCAPTPAAPDAVVGGALAYEGDSWACTFDGKTVRTRAAKGIADLAVLLSRPGEQVHVRSLGDAGSVPAGGSAQPVLDGQAVAMYRQRLRDLEADLDEAERQHDSERAAMIAAGRDALVDQLSRAFGLGGRPRSLAGDPDERLRKAVSARVKASIERIESLHPSLGRHLRHSVRTGYWCSYQPEHPAAWDITDRSG